MLRVHGFTALLTALFTLHGCSPDVLDDDDQGDDEPQSDDDVSDDDTGSDDDTDSDDDSNGDDDSSSQGDYDGDEWTIFEGDCDDWDPEVNPGAEEVLCDGVDNDCDGLGGGSSAAVVEGQEYSTLGTAVAAAAGGGIVQVCPGIHTEQVYIDDNSELTLTSWTEDPTDTIGRILREGAFLTSNHAAESQA